MNRRVGNLKLGLVASCLAIGALWACSGCGGGETSTPTSAGVSSAAAAPPAKAQLIQRADAICRRTDQAQKAALQAYFNQHEVEMTDGPEMEKAISRAEIPPLRAEIEQVAALPVPAGDEASIGAIVTGWQVALRAAERQPGSIFGLGEGPFEKSDQLAKRYGFKDCAEAL